MRRDASRKDVHALDRALDGRLKGSPVAGGKMGPGVEDNLLDLLVRGGPALPATAHLDSLRTAFMARGEALRQQAPGSGSEAIRPVRQVRVKTHPVFARVAAVAAAVMVLLVGLGFGSAYAMPGNPLYSVKRMAESAYISVVPGDQNKADSYASWTNRRLNDLKYVEGQGMGDWYYGFVEDAQGGIENTYQHGKRLRAGASKRVSDKAKALALRLEGLLGKAQSQMTPAQKAKTESGMDRLRLQLRMRRGAPSGPSQQNGQPGNQNGQQQNSQQNGAPGGPGTQQQQNQQQQNQLQQQCQPTQQVSPQQDQGPGGPSPNQGNQEQQSPRQGEGSESSVNEDASVPGQSPTPPS